MTESAWLKSQMRQRYEAAVYASTQVVVAASFGLREAAGEWSSDLVEPSTWSVERFVATGDAAWVRVADSTALADAFRFRVAADLGVAMSGDIGVQEFGTESGLSAGWQRVDEERAKELLVSLEVDAAGARALRAEARRLVDAALHEPDVASAIPALAGFLTSHIISTRSGVTDFLEEWVAVWEDERLWTDDRFEVRLDSRACWAVTCRECGATWTPDILRPAGQGVRRRGLTGCFPRCRRGQESRCSGAGLHSVCR